MNRNELSKLDARLRILEKTRDLLEQARDSLSGRYMKKMEKAFSAYLAELQSGEHISIDKDLNVYVEGAGSTYGSEYLSEGYKDIVNFCIRMALVDAMFETEQPVLILDDPFVNLDKDKIANALRVVGLFLPAALSRPPGDSDRDERCEGGKSGGNAARQWPVQQHEAGGKEEQAVGEDEPGERAAAKKEIRCADA